MTNDRPKPETISVQRLSWLDHVLAGVAACLTVYSIGAGLGESAIGMFFIVMIVFGTTVSVLATRVLSDKAAVLDGYLYLAGALLSVFYATQLNLLLPEEGIPRELLVAGVLCWMLSFGSFFMWRDATVLFQAVPGIALFGLVGAWDTFAGAPFAFFGFLLCFATLFARTHARGMLMQAESSGYVDPSGLAKSNRLWEALKNGPWRWMAGPEWALASAAVVIVLSVLGAPALQASVQGVAGFVSINVPQPPPRPNASSDPLQNLVSGSTTPVGTGPRRIEHQPLFRMHLDEQRYLRMQTYDRYTGRGWQPVQDFGNQQEMVAAIDKPDSLLQTNRESIERPVVEPFTVQLLIQHTDAIPIPGELDTIHPHRQFAFRPDGTIRVSGYTRESGTIQGTFRKPGVPIRLLGRPENPAPPARFDLPGVYTNDDDATAIPDRVRQLARDVTAGVEGDWQKAMAIKREIERRARYNINAQATPPGIDPVEHFLFESQEGYCDLFASAMVLMTRSIGLPARYVTGFFPWRHIRDNRGLLIVHQSESHAWAELFFEEIGWVAFDPTEGADTVEGGGLGQANQATPFFERTWVRVMLFALGGLLLIGLPFLVRWIVHRRNSRLMHGRTQIGVLYARLINRLERYTGKPRRPSQTPFEYIEALRPYLDGTFASVRELNGRFVKAFYGPADPDPELVQALRQGIADIELSLRTAKPGTPQQS
jgi:transglutaminase-like putative cysteine protease